jgi:hypothetical protein
MNFCYILLKTKIISYTKKNNLVSKPLTETNI